MTSIFYRTQTYNNAEQPTEATKESWAIYANKENWRIVLLHNDYYQAEIETQEGIWEAMTRRATIEECESAIDSSIDHYQQRIRAAQAPVVVKTFK